MNSLAQWSLIVAFFVPLVMSVLNQSKWSAQIKAGLFFAVSLVAAAGTAYFQGDLTGKRFVDSALVIVAAGAAFYQGWWKPVGVAPKLEEVTNL